MSVLLNGNQYRSGWIQRPINISTGYVGI